MVIDKEIENWDEFISQYLGMISLENPKKQIYKTIIISDELFEKNSKHPPIVKLGEEWEDTQRCPLCGEYMFQVHRRSMGLARYDSEGDELYISNLKPQVNTKKCRCGVELYIENERINLDY